MLALDIPLLDGCTTGEIETGQSMSVTMQYEGIIPEDKDGDQVRRNGRTWRTMTALIHPLIGGILAVQSCTRADSSAAEVTSQGEVTIQTPFISSSETTSSAACDDGPEREGTIRYLAPRSTIHRKIARPIPPNPPGTT